MIPQNLNKSQQEAVDSLGGPLLIAAGAGSGKTKTLTSLLLAALSSGIPGDRIVAITFTNKAAKEMAERLGPALKGLPQKPFIGTFHSLGARILKSEAERLGRNSNFTIFDNNDSSRLIRQIVKSMNLSKENYGPSIFEGKLSRIKNEVADTSDLPADNEMERLAASVFFKYEKALEENNAFDFDDLIEKPVRLFLEYPEIKQKYQNKFDHIFVDEYQDINTAQYLLIKLLAEKHMNISVVGDDAQSIYKFRGSDFKNFLNFERDWPGAKVVFLEENYRSTSNIIKAASAVISNNKFQKPKNLWTKNEGGSLVQIIETPDEKAEALWVVEEIGKSRRLENKGTTSGSVAILYRTNAQSRPIEQMLIEYGIPYQIFGGLKFYERYEIKDIVAALRYGLNPKDSISLERLEKNLYRAPFRELKESLPEKAIALSPMELINYFLQTADYFGYLERNYKDAKERIENIAELIDFASGFKNISDFVEQISLAQSADKPGGEKGKNPIQLMTIHSAKGLEFDRVFLIGASEGLLPHQMSLRNGDEMEEERRLMYVAMTRARKDLILSFHGIPSRFLYEIPPELIDFKSLYKKGVSLPSDDDIYID